MAASVERASPAKQEKVTVRLMRFGPRKAGGLSRFRHRGITYRRDGLYAVVPDLARLLLSTGKFECVPPELLEQAKREAKTPRGISLEERARLARAARRRPSPMSQEPVMQPEAGDVAEVSGQGLEL